MYLWFLCPSYHLPIFPASIYPILGARHFLTPRHPRRSKSYRAYFFAKTRKMWVRAVGPPRLCALTHIIQKGICCRFYFPLTTYPRTPYVYHTHTDHLTTHKMPFHSFFSPPCSAFYLVSSSTSSPGYPPHTHIFFLFPTRHLSLLPRPSQPPTAFISHPSIFPYISHSLPSSTAKYVLSILLPTSLPTGPTNSASPTTYPPVRLSSPHRPFSPPSHPRLTIPPTRLSILTTAETYMKVILLF